MNYSLDTNILIRFFLNEEEARRVNELLGDSRKKFHISDLVISEIVFVLQKLYRVSRPTITEFLHYLIERENINLNRNWLSLCLEIYVKQHALSFVDIAALVYARLNSATPLITQDKDLLKYTGKDAKSL